VTGDWRQPGVDGDTIVMDNGMIEVVGTASGKAVSTCDVVIDADGATAVPGFIDSQVHNTLVTILRVKKRSVFWRVTFMAARPPV